MDVNDWDSASRDSLRALGSDGTVVTCTSGGATRKFMSNESRHLDLLAAARSRDGRLEVRTIAKCARQHRCGVLGALEDCAQFDPAPASPNQDGREGLRRQDERSMTSSPEPKKGVSSHLRQVDVTDQGLR